jgi:hypothetical protein
MVEHDENDNENEHDCMGKAQVGRGSVRAGASPARFGYDMTPVGSTSGVRETPIQRLLPATIKERERLGARAVRCFGAFPLAQ